MNTLRSKLSLKVNSLLALNKKVQNIVEYVEKCQ